MTSTRGFFGPLFKPAIIAAVLTGLWGCSGDDDPKPTPEPNPTVEPTPEPTPAPTPAPTPEPSNTAIIFEAEGGGIATMATLGSDMQVVVDADDASITYVTTQVNGTQPPEDSNRVVSLNLEFPEAGTWVVFARVRIGPQGANDDSFYVDTDLGDETQWGLVNGISGAVAPGEPGYDADDAPYVGVGGNSSTETWLWTKVPDLEYVVDEGNLAVTFNYAGREDGLDIDKFAIAKPDYNFTTAQIEGGLAGDQLDPSYEPSPYTPPEDQQPMAAAREKFVGNVCCGNQAVNFTAYFNQVVPENAGKWGSVEAERDVYNWDNLDEAVALAEDNGYPFRFHVLLWGSQQPAWMTDLPPAEQLEEIEEWFELVAERYGDKITHLEVVNEFISQTPCSKAANRGGYVEALGTACVERPSDGELVPEDDEWILAAFRLADEHFPSSVQLMLNEYSVINEDAKATRYVDVVDKLKAENLIDAIGLQTHAFSTRGGNAQMQANLDRLAATGLPMISTELDIDSPQFANGDDDQVAQLMDYQRIFPLVYEHPGVIGVTLWGYRPGMWRDNQGATLAFEEGEEKLAFRWLNGYLRQNAPAVSGPESVSLALDAAIGSDVADFSADLTLAGDAINDQNALNWVIASGNEEGLFEFVQESGMLVLADTPVAGTYNIQIYAEYGQVVSSLVSLQVVVE